MFRNLIPVLADRYHVIAPDYRLLRELKMKNGSMISHWVPAAFCAFLSLTALTVQIRANASVLMAAFFCFLPMCFFFVGIVTASMHRELRQLRDRLAALERETRQG